MQIQNSPSGIVRSTTKGYQAFVPNPLPPNFVWSSALVKALSRADYALGRLSTEGRNLPNPHLLMRPFITREAVLSSRIEGTQATIGEVLVSDVETQSAHISEGLLEVRNYVDALEHGIQRLNELPLSLRLIKEIHQHLMQGVRGNHATPGEFRRSQNWIGSPGSTLSTAKYIPPEPADMLDSLSDLERFLHDTQLPPLVQIALAHYQFEAIHPFLDGNGRVGRLLITLMLIEKKLLPTPLLYLSAFFEASRSTYYDLLYDVSAKGSWEEWLVYFLNGVASQSEDAVLRAERINSLLRQWQIKAASRRSRTSLELVRCLAINPFLTVNRAAKELNVAFTTAQRAVKNLESIGIVQETTQAKRDRLYCAVEILRILDEPTEIRSWEL